jgi:hypothetical protein
MNELEQKLSRQPVRRIPAEWRAEILAAAELPPRPAPRASFLSGRNQQLSMWLWPHPKAWAGLAAVWILIFTVDFSARDRRQLAAEKSAPPSLEAMAEVRRQKLLFAQLIGPDELRAAVAPRSFLPRPRSERAKISVM